MSPKLVAIAGPSKGLVFPISWESFAIGREASNSLCLEDASVSRWHSVVSYTGEECTLKDLDSRNGTFVNGVPIRERVLENSDEIRIGKSIFLYVLAEDAAREPDPGPDDSAPVTQSFVIRPGESLFLKPAELARAVASDSRTAADLNSLLRITREITSISSVEALRAKLVGLVMEVIPANEAWMILAGDDAASPKIRPVADEAMLSGTAILSDGSPAHLAAPLAAFDKRHGVIAAVGKRFDEAHLQLLTAIGSVAGLCLQNALHLQWLEGENTRLRAEMVTEHNMVGESPRIREVLRIVGKAAPSGVTVLIRGESGTGKELVARAIAGSRYVPFDADKLEFAERPGETFFAINVAALSPALIESELFGHRRGSFTGAISDRKGWLETCPPQGTVFLDELGEMEVLLQVKLLRAIETRRFSAVGDTSLRDFRGKLIAATNRDLRAEIGCGHFREDLYYRLCADLIRTPSLQEQIEASPAVLRELTLFMVRRVAGDEAASCVDEVHQWIATKLPESYPWPGNYRELEQCVRNIIIRGSYQPVSGSGEPGFWDDFRAGRLRAEEVLAYYSSLVYRQCGSYEEAARRMGVDRRTVKARIDGAGNGRE